MVRGAAPCGEQPLPNQSILYKNNLRDEVRERKETERREINTKKMCTLHRTNRCICAFVCVFRLVGQSLLVSETIQRTKSILFICRVHKQVCAHRFQACEILKAFLPCSNIRGMCVCLLWTQHKAALIITALLLLSKSLKN